MGRLGQISAMSLCLAWASWAAPTKQKVDFEEHSIEGELVKPSATFIMERKPTQFPCDISQLSLSEYTACYDRHLAERCGLQVIERERYELKKFAGTAVQGGTTVAGLYPYSVHLEDGTLYLQEASQFDATWGDRVAVLQNQSPRLQSVDWFVSGSPFVFGERKHRRIYVVDPKSFFENEAKFRRVELASQAHVLLGVTTTQKLLVRTQKEMLLMGLNARQGQKVRVPLDDYQVDPQADRNGNILLTSAIQSQGYIVGKSAQVVASFYAEPGFTYLLLPNGLLATANKKTGDIKIRTQTGAVLSKTRVGKPMSQFGLFHHGKSADLFYVTDEGLGVLYPDGFEKSFLAKEGGELRVVQSSQDVLALLISSPSREAPRSMRERTVEYYQLGRSPSRIARVVEGICPDSVRAAERALDLKPSLKATVRTGVD